MGRKSSWPPREELRAWMERDRLTSKEAAEILGMGTPEALRAYLNYKYKPQHLADVAKLERAQEKFSELLPDDLAPEHRANEISQALVAHARLRVPDEVVKAHERDNVRRVEELLDAGNMILTYDPAKGYGVDTRRQTDPPDALLRK